MALVNPHGGSELKPLLLEGSVLKSELEKAKQLLQVKVSSREKGDIIMLGIGWFNPLPLRMWNTYNLRDYLPTGEPRFIAQLRIEFADGTSETIVSDETWKAADGPLLRNSVYLGELYDARR